MFHGLQRHFQMVKNSHFVTCWGTPELEARTVMVYICWTIPAASRSLLRRSQGEQHWGSQDCYMKYFKIVNHTSLKMNQLMTRSFEEASTRRWLHHQRFETFHGVLQAQVLHRKILHTIHLDHGCTTQRNGQIMGEHLRIIDYMMLSTDTTCTNDLVMMTAEI